MSALYKMEQYIIECFYVYIFEWMRISFFYDRINIFFYVRNRYWIFYFLSA